jgi:hypothetical protein
MTDTENFRFLVQVWRDQVLLDFIRTDDERFAETVFQHFCDNYKLAYVEFWNGDTLIADINLGNP